MKFRYSIFLLRNFLFKGTIDSNSKNKQVLDRLEVERYTYTFHFNLKLLPTYFFLRKRGITVKAQTASMFYKLDKQDYLLNLIDTPVHF
jgi:translation elongation factor EF-4